MVTDNAKLDREREFHDRRFAEDGARQQKVGKFYQITKSILREKEKMLFDSCQGARVIEYGCGTGSYAFKLAQQGAELVTGIDISPVAIAKAQEEASVQGVDEKTNFVVMNAENLEFAPDSYDLICGSGILHHLDLNLAIDSIVKVLKPNGKAIFLEPLGHNVVINLYRRLTPSIRSEDEHPLLDRDLAFFGQHFRQINIKYFYLTSLAASFIAGKPGFNTVLKSLELLDSVLLKLPIVKKQAWMVLIELSEPLK
ncbi:class I SAM-dependent methyltransferase [Pleurocapsales cyanobacterium LEGE 10410]|nr:class I SAM-dependent methyltransferase [Pleurocapsales cyanobacterium LEGE 10410]